MSGYLALSYIGAMSVLYLFSVGTAYEVLRRPFGTMDGTWFLALFWPVTALVCGLVQVARLGTRATRYLHTRALARRQDRIPRATATYTQTMDIRSTYPWPGDLVPPALADRGVREGHADL